MVEHTYKESLSKCLKSKRIAVREVNPQRVRFECKKVNALTEIYMGQKKIFVQQYSKKVTHLSQQGYGKKKVQRRKNTSRKNTKKN